LGGVVGFARGRAAAEGRGEIIKRAGKAGIFIVRPHVFAGTGGACTAADSSGAGIFSMCCYRPPPFDGSVLTFSLDHVSTINR